MDLADAIDLGSNAGFIACSVSAETTFGQVVFSQLNAPWDVRVTSSGDPENPPVRITRATHAPLPSGKRTEASFRGDAAFARCVATAPSSLGRSCAVQMPTDAVARTKKKDNSFLIKTLRLSAKRKVRSGSVISERLYASACHETSTYLIRHQVDHRDRPVAMVCH